MASKNLFRHNYSFIENILNSFVSHDVDFNKKYEQGQSLEEISLQRYKLDIENQEEEKKNNGHYYKINHIGLYTLFAFFRKTDDISLLSYLSLQNYLPKEVVAYILKYFCSLTFEKTIYRSYAQQYAPQYIDNKFEAEKRLFHTKEKFVEKLARTLYTEINEKINPECKFT